MKTLLTVNLSTKTAEAGDGGWEPPPLVYGETLTLALRLQELRGGDAVEVTDTITATKAALGNLDARPESGTWALQIGAGAQSADNTTAALPYNASPGALAAAINARAAVVTAYGAASVQSADDSYLITFATATAAVPLTVRDNRLWPASYGEVMAYAVDEVWQHELRLIQAPVAFTDAAERVLPPAPSVTRLQEGGGDVTAPWNELQSLYAPPDFRGTYQLRSGAGLRTVELTLADTPETVQAALETLFGRGNISVRSAENFTVRIEWTGEEAGSPQELLEVEALNPPPGDLTFTLRLDRAELWIMLRRQASVRLPLEVRLYVENEEEVEEKIAFRQLLTIQRPLIWPSLATVPLVDWLRPLSPNNYIPFSRTTVLDGQKFYPDELGNGALTEFTIAHGLDSEVVDVCVRENQDDGLILVNGTDYRVRVMSANSVKVISLVGAPATDAWFAVVRTANTIASFANGLTVDIDQVNGLPEALAAMAASIDALEAQAATAPLGISTGELVMEVPIPPVSEIFPAAPDEGGKARGGLLPALHDATVTSYTSGDLPEVVAAAGSVYQNNSSTALQLTGGLRTKGSSVAIGGYFGSDGRRLIPLSRNGTTSSYFPRDFERELFFFEVSSQMLRAGKSLDLDFTIALALLGSLSRAQWRLVIEWAPIVGQTSPGTPATNLQAVDFSTGGTLLSQRVILGPVEVPHVAGAQIIRAASGTLSANKVLYKLATAADSVPASADVALRARLIEFDTENSVSDPRGAVSWKLANAKYRIS